MQPLHFGESSKPLYGVYHEPRNAWRNEAVLLLYPAGSEYMRIHRAFVRLANMLADDGFAVFRFDCSGTGDSYGDECDISLGDWERDTLAACEELVAMSGAETLSVVAARLGTTLATRLAGKKALNKMVLWEPVGKGKDYLKHMQSSLTAASLAVEGFDINGFYYSKELIAGINGYDFYQGDWLSRVANPVLLFADEKVLADFNDYSEFDRQKVKSLKIECLADWLELDNLGRIFLPQGVLAKISEVLSQNAPSGEPA